MDNGSSRCMEKPPAEPLQRVGSGTSDVLDPETTGSGHGCVEAESRKLPSSHYKGVVPQPNGRWGAQIYEKHQRVWLGTFNEESDAAKAYDVAAQRFRGRDAVTNFKPLSESNDADIAELGFLNRHCKTEIVDMLRKHTYGDELQHSKRLFVVSTSINVNNESEVITKETALTGARSREHLFEKAVTPSDVGKLNRLVIPKQQAEKHFPVISGSGASCKGVLLNFEDAAGKVWRFRYSYWNSSQSYVLTKGWSRFVKEKRLQAGDTVNFQRSKGDDGEKQLYIDCRPRARPVLVVRLFGVNIFKMPAADGRHHHVGIKRSRDLDHHHRLISSSPPSAKFLIKKQCTAAL